MFPIFSKTPELRKAYYPSRPCELLLEGGAELRLHDPVANANSKRLLPARGVESFDNPYEAAFGADCVLVLTEWNEFRNLELAKLYAAMSGRLLLDIRNVYDPMEASRIGFVYEGMGRTVVANGSVANEPPEPLIAAELVAD